MPGPAFVQLCHSLAASGVYVVGLAWLLVVLSALRHR